MKTYILAAILFLCGCAEQEKSYICWDNTQDIPRAYSATSSDGEVFYVQYTPDQSTVPTIVYINQSNELWECHPVGDD